MHLSRMTLVDSAADLAANRISGTYGHHQTVWAFYADDPEAKRDFVYRFDLHREGARFFTVSRRPPAQMVPGWRIESRAYAPDVEAGARLRFSLRANPTKRLAEEGQRSDGARHDVVMIRKRQQRDRGETVDMPRLVHEAGFEWLARQGERHGFAIQPEEVRIDGYQPHRFRRPRDGRDLTVTGMDYEGILSVTDPAAFGNSLRSGIGPAKGFGFGLLLVRRA